AYNSLAPKGAPNASQWLDKGVETTEERQNEDGENDEKATYTFGNAPVKADADITKDGLPIGLEVPAEGDPKPIYANKLYQPEPQVGQESWTDTDGTEEKYGGRVLKPDTKMKPCYGSFAKPTNVKGGQAKVKTEEGNNIEYDIDMNFFDLRSQKQGLKPKIVMYAENVDLESPDTHVVYKPEVSDASSNANLGQQSMPNRPNYIGFRDNFIGLMYYNSTGNMGVLAGQASQLNAVVDLQDRNTELSYQLLLDSLGDRT
ncbi:hypothetical protein F0A30_14680, partial [Listeria monocytogenes]|nr:hypothetical protein [Listeria monocytogenes]